MKLFNLLIGVGCSGLAYWMYSSAGLDWKVVVFGLAGLFYLIIGLTGKQKEVGR